jgi:Domain of unknown function (DUF4268)
LATSRVERHCAWTHGADIGVCEILLRNPVDPSDEPLWPTYFDWMRRSLETFQRVIGSRIEKFAPAQSLDAPGTTTSKTRGLYVEYWSALRDRLNQNHSVMKSRKPQPIQWTNFKLGRPGFELAAVASVTNKEIRVALVLGGTLAKPHFYLLVQERDTMARMSRNLGFS